MQKTCVKCGHENPSAAGRDDDACPRCGAIYAKARVTASRPINGRYSLEVETVQAKRAAPGAQPPRRATHPLIWGGVVLVLPLSLLFPKIFGPESSIVQRQMDTIHEQVAADSIRQYSIARQHGGPMDACVQAGMVAAAFLQAKKDSQYAQWKATESADCARAGLPK